MRLDYDVTSVERDKLIRYCFRYTHEWSCAEDLAQQTLLESWLKQDEVYSAEARFSWLIGAARNVCLRWLRRQRRANAHVYTVSDDEPDVFSSVEDSFDLEQIVEQQELAHLLKQAMTLLPDQTRIVLTQCYLEGVPQAEMAAHLGVSLGAIEARLDRGKRALRRLFTHDMASATTGYKFESSTQAGWQSTQMWCPTCGRQRLVIRQSDSPETIAFRCPGCNDRSEDVGWEYQLSNPQFARRVAGLTQPKAILRHISSWAYDYYFAAVSRHGLVACARCGQHRRLRLTSPTHDSAFSLIHTSAYGLIGHCPACGWRDFCSLAGLLHCLPAVQHCWQAHPRMRLVFHEPLEEAAGQRAFVASFESMTDASQVDIVMCQDTLALIPARQ